MVRICNQSTFKTLDRMHQSTVYQTLTAHRIPGSGMVFAFFSFQSHDLQCARYFISDIYLKYVRGLFYYMHREYFIILCYNQQMHNYFTNYHTATCFDTIVSSSDSL